MINIYNACIYILYIYIHIYMYIYNIYMYISALFSGKSAATVFNNKIELFEKVEGQDPGVF